MHTDFVAATSHFEDWMRTLISLQESELDYKHIQMATADSVFPFFRGVYYRWAEVWPVVCPDCQTAPSVLAVGDLHIENFGTWRDREGRLVWGINDFDEADDLPFTNDLVRLAASAFVGADGAEFRLTRKKMCRAILTGYTEQLQRGGRPFVLEEDHQVMRSLATQSDRDPVKFWKKLTALLKQDPAEISEEVDTALKRDLQGASSHAEVRLHLHVGMGSLGKPRYVALANLMGAWVAREAKAITPAATVFLNSERPIVSRVEEILSRAVRCADPFHRVDGTMIVRRLAPRCARIEQKMLTNVKDEKVLFESMGAETANIHCGSLSSRDAIVSWLAARPATWLEEAATAMISATRADWKSWRRYMRQHPKPL